MPEDPVDKINRDALRDAKHRSAEDENISLLGIPGPPRQLTLSSAQLAAEMQKYTKGVPAGETTEKTPNAHSNPPPIAELWNWLGYHLVRDWPMIAKAPIAMLAVGAVAAFVSWFITYQLFVPHLRSMYDDLNSHYSTLKDDRDRLTARVEERDHQIEALKSDREKAIKTVTENTGGFISVNPENEKRILATIDAHTYRMNTLQFQLTMAGSSATNPFAQPNAAEITKMINDEQSSYIESMKALTGEYNH